MTHMTKDDSTHMDLLIDQQVIMLILHHNGFPLLETMSNVDLIKLGLTLYPRMMLSFLISLPPSPRWWEYKREPPWLF